MNNASESVSQLDTIPETPLSESIQQLFSRLRNSDVEQFMHAYQLWTLHQQMNLLDLQIALIQQEILANEEQLHLLQPTSIELATLAQLQSSGVSDIDLLDRMHTRGEVWLDNAIQLLEHCERLDMIQGDYTQWCEHALEGAYDWLSSIDDDDLSQAQPASTQPSESVAYTQEKDADEYPERLLLQKLFGENEETISKESWTEPDTERPEEPSDTNITVQNTTSEETAGEDASEQSEAETAETPTTASDPEIEIPEPETTTEQPELETNTEQAEEPLLNEENLSSSAESPEEEQNTETFTPIAANSPPSIQEVQDGSEQAEDQEAQEISEQTANLEEQTRQIEHTEAFKEEPEQNELAEETEEEMEQLHLSKRNRLINRFVGRIFPKG